jgi:hypothetical protein
MRGFKGIMCMLQDLKSALTRSASHRTGSCGQDRSNSSAPATTRKLQHRS